MVYAGSVAWCSVPNGPRVIAMPHKGCSIFEREPGTDDDPDTVPVPVPTGADVQGMLSKHGGR
jgi:hypothetical protein